MIAHIAYAGEAVPGVIRSVKSSDELGRSAVKALHPTNDKHDLLRVSQ